MPLFRKNKSDKEKLCQQKVKECSSYPRNQPISYGMNLPSYQEATSGQTAAMNGQTVQHRPPLGPHGSFDSGARFDNITPPSIPPPPPGVMPNQAQMAVMHGQPVLMSKAKTLWKEPSSDGGYTFF